MKVDKLRTVIIYIIIILPGLVCLLPLLNIVAISFSSSAAVEGNMVGLIPVGFSTAAYEKTFSELLPSAVVAGFSVRTFFVFFLFWRHGKLLVLCIFLFIKSIGNFIQFVNMFAVFDFFCIIKG